MDARLVVLATALCACGPAGVDGSGDGTTSSGTGTTSNATESGDEDETGSDTTSTPDVQEVCDVFDQESCDDGEKCAPVATEGSSFDWNVCVPVLGDKQRGENCERLGEGLDGLDDCGVGLFCSAFLGSGEPGRCIEHCSGPLVEASCSDGFKCEVYACGCVPLCRQLCHPLDPMDCEFPEEVCVPYTDDFICRTQAGTGGGQNSTCNFFSACDLGLFCGHGALIPGCDTGQCCTSYCQVGANTCPDANLGVECVPWFEEGEGPPEYQDVGACYLPG